MKGSNVSRHFISVYFLGVILIVSACKKDEAICVEGTNVLHPVGLDVPGNFPRPSSDPDNPLTSEGIALGKMLFYDTRLSGNNRISCASCHRSELAFSDGVALSTIGESGQTLLRHSPALINMVWMDKGLFWDGGATNLESQAFGPLTSADEMHQNLNELEYELSQVPAYVQQFRVVFNSGIKAAAVVKALAQFERTLISGNSRYDRYIRKEQGATLTAEELKGLNLVNSKCRSCHAGELFTDNDFHNNGLDTDFSNTTFEGVFQGRYRITYQLSDLGKFKTPTLRNVQFTAPYMHDGRFATLDQVLTNYAQNAGLGTALSETEKKAILIFLKSLTDSSFIQNKNLQQPI